MIRIKARMRKRTDFLSFSLRRAGCLALLFLVAASVVMVEHPANAVQRETHEEKESNLKQQATGGLFHQWTFDKDERDKVPVGFVRRSWGEGQATWRVVPDESAPSRPHVVAVSSHCAVACYQLLLAEGLDYEYPDIAVRFRADGSAPAIGGVVLGVKDAANFYAAVMNVAERTVQVVRIIEGKETVLAQTQVQWKPVDWHSLRVQRNTIISKDFIETFVDGTLMLSVEDQMLGLGQVGLVTHGNSSLFFDSFHAVPLFSHRPLSSPAAY
jgi:hypothetical protein